jgi:putative hydrolase of the HAD superfamily
VVLEHRTEHDERRMVADGGFRGMRMIRTVFWDIGGVLLENGYGRSQRAGVYADLQLTPADIAEAEGRRDEANWYWERGLIDEAEFFKRTLFYTPRTFTLSEVWTSVESQQKVLHPECIAMLQRMHARRQVRLAALNNESRELNAFRLKQFELRQYFDFCICSAYVHEMKPAAGIYRSALEIGGDKPGEACFIDDNEDNIAAAHAAGFVGLHFTSPSALRAQLDALGIEL